jgi:hypothetical protein
LTLKSTFSDIVAPTSELCVPNNLSTIFLKHLWGYVIPWVRNGRKILCARWGLGCGESGYWKSNLENFEWWHNNLRQDLVMTCLQRYFRQLLAQYLHRV